MKSAISVALIPVLIAAPVRAQTTPVPPPSIVKAQPADEKADLSTPAKTLETFINAIKRSDLRTAVCCVSGATYTDKTAAFEKYLLRMNKDTQASLHLSVETEPVPANRQIMILQCVISRDNWEPPLFEKVGVMFTLEGKEWKIKPPSVEEIQAKSFYDVFHGRMTTALAFAVRNPFLAVPEQPLPGSDAVINANYVARATLMYVEDHEGVFPPQRTPFANLLSPYLHRVRSWAMLSSSTPPDAPTTGNLKFNPSLAGRKMSEVKRRGGTILLYDGEWKRLVFRYNGKALVAFTDGRSQLVTQAEAQRLIWSLPPRIPAKPKKASRIKSHKDR